MPTVLSLVRPDQQNVQDNHAYYAKTRGYRHVVCILDIELHPLLQVSMKYHLVCQQLRQIPQDDLLLFLNGDTVVKDPVDLVGMIGNAPGLVIEGPGQQGEAANLGHAFLLRNCTQGRHLARQLMEASGKWVAQEPNSPTESELLRTSACFPASSVYSDAYVLLSWRTIDWFKVKVFLIHLGPIEYAGSATVPVDTAFKVPGLQRLVVNQVNRYLMHAEPVLSTPAYPAISDTAYSVVNEHSRIAFVTLYTHHINSYARVSEHNVKRYCERHGYAYHVYRAIPPELDPAINGTWVKSWLVKRHLANHEWVFWIDADVLFFNQPSPIDRVIAGRDLVLAKDIGTWQFNAGVMGFRNTTANLELLETIWQRISAVPDKSTVYSSQGDQFYTNVVLAESGLLEKEETVLDSLTINTPCQFLRENTLLVHYVGLYEPYRSALMAHDDQVSQRIG